MSRRNEARAAAIAAGARHYEGEPCAAGHTARWTVSRCCVACQREALKRRRAGAVSMVTDDFEEML